MGGVAKIVDFRHLSRRVSETVQGSKLLLTTNRNMHTRFRLVPKSMTMNDLWARFKVIGSLNAKRRNKAIVSDAMYRVAGCIISIRPTDSCARALTYLYRITSVLASCL